MFADAPESSRIRMLLFFTFLAFLLLLFAGLITSRNKMAATLGENSKCSLMYFCLRYNNCKSKRLVKNHQDIYKKNKQVHRGASLTI